MSRVKRHTLATRVLHGSLALVVILQLVTSQFMHGPRPDHPANLWFFVHEYSGLLAAALALGFWIATMLRLRGTPLGKLVPWFTAARRDALIDDLRTYRTALAERRLPSYVEDSPVASAIHGLGLLLISAMAGTGTIYFLGIQAGQEDTNLFQLAIGSHELLANLVYVYLIGHAGMALVHQLMGRASIGEMWSLQPDTKTIGE